MNLKDYPRPQNDNGIGIHFRLDVTETGNKPYISQGVEWLQSIHAKWALVAVQDWIQLRITAGPIWAAGIMPICRLVCKIDKPYIDWENGVKTLQDLGIPPYMQIFNEPGDLREWNKHPNISMFGAKWADAAARIYAAGGYPGIQVLGQNEWQAAFDAVKAANQMHVWDRAWFCLHNYGSNHPPSYPYDDVNQNGTPITPADYAAQQFSLPIDEVNALRKSSTHPGATASTDGTTVLRFLEYMPWMMDTLGYCLPFIGGEGGWEWGNEEDHRYSKLTPDQHANYHKSMLEWFSTGVLANGDPLPDELFSIAPWIMADGGADSWWYGPLGTKQGTIDAVASIPSFVRKFSWDNPPTPSTPPISVTPGTPATEGSTGTPPATTPGTPPADQGTTPPATTPGTPPADQGTTPPATTPGTPPADQGTTPPTTTTPPAAPAMVTYVVQQGETLWGIAKKFGTSVDAIVKANNIANPSLIRVGQKLNIPR